MPRANLALSGLAFQGLTQSLTTTSGTRVPSSSGSDQGQQKPAVILALLPAPCFSRINASSSSTLSAILNSNASSPSQRILAVSLMPSVLFTQLMNPSEPPQRN